MKVKFIFNLLFMENNEEKTKLRRKLERLAKQGKIILNPKGGGNVMQISNYPMPRKKQNDI